MLAQASGDDVIRDCAEDGDLDQDYSDEELEDAKQNMPSDIDQYSDCRDVIQPGAGRRPRQHGRRRRDRRRRRRLRWRRLRGSVTGDDSTGSKGGTPGDANELGIRKQQAEEGIAPDTSADHGGRRRRRRR